MFQKSSLHPSIPLQPGVLSNHHLNSPGNECLYWSNLAKLQLDRIPQPGLEFISGMGTLFIQLARHLFIPNPAAPLVEAGRSIRFMAALFQTPLISSPISFTWNSVHLSHSGMILCCSRFTPGQVFSWQLLLYAHSKPWCAFMLESG